MNYNFLQFRKFIRVYFATVGVLDDNIGCVQKYDPGTGNYLIEYDMHVKDTKNYGAKSFIFDIDGNLNVKVDLIIDGKVTSMFKRPIKVYDFNDLSDLENVVGVDSASSFYLDHKDVCGQIILDYCNKEITQYMINAYRVSQKLSVDQDDRIIISDEEQMSILNNSITDQLHLLFEKIHDSTIDDSVYNMFVGSLIHNSYDYKNRLEAVDHRKDQK